MAKIPKSDLLLTELENHDIEYFRGDNNAPYARVKEGDAYKIYEIDSNTFRDKLSYIYYKKYKSGLSKYFLDEVIGTLSARAKFDGERFELSVRCAKYQGEFWYALCNDKSQSVKTTDKGWEVVDNTPIIFQPYPHQKPQVIPQGNGDIDKIFDYVRLGKDNNTLFLAYLVSCFIPEISHPVPIFFGSAGSAKTTTNKVVKLLVDPSTYELLPLPSTIKHLVDGFTKHWWCGFDNISGISKVMSDEICKAVTGGTAYFRKLYTDS